jgi:hypothetical protein
LLKQEVIELCPHVPLEEQTSFVHALLSVAHASPVAAGYEHTFPEHVFVVHALLSSHWVAERQQPEIGVFVHPPPEQTSSVHKLLSLHCVAEVQQLLMAVFTHRLLEQLSIVHILLSLH